MADEPRKFPSECNPRGVVKTSDKILIWNSDTGASDEFATIAELTKIQDDAIAELELTAETIAEALTYVPVSPEQLQNAVGDIETLLYAL